MNWQDLGALEGALLCFGGPYSNLQAVQALIAAAERLGIPGDRAICTGDVAAYGADPAECWAAVQGWARATVAGNVERQVAAGEDDCGCGFGEGSACDLASRGWYPRALAAFGAAERQAMAALPGGAVFTHAGRRYAVIHGGATDVARFLWPSSPEGDFEAERDAIIAAVGPVDAVIAGHCGIAFTRRLAGIDWLNAGVIGMPPHDGRTQTRFLTLSAEGRPMIRRLGYDHETAAARMRAAGLVQGYEGALGTGIWPSEDVLPVEMRR